MNSLSLSYVLQRERKERGTYQIEPAHTKNPLGESLFFNEELFISSYLFLLNKPSFALRILEFRKFKNFLTASPLLGTFEKVSTSIFLPFLLKKYPIREPRDLIKLYLILSEIEMNVPEELQNILYERFIHETA